MAKPKPKPNPAAAAAAGVAAAVAPAASTEAAPTSASAFVLEDNVPFPERKYSFGPRESIYPFAHMNVGQSFLVQPTDKNPEPWKTLSSLASRMSRAMHPKVFVTAREERNGKECVRIWRKPDTTEPLAPPRARKTKAQKEAEAAAQGQAVAPASPPPPPAFG